MDLMTTKNPYEHYEHTVQTFKELVAKKKEMEETFHPSMLNEYKTVKCSMVETAVELLRLGVEKRLDEENVYLTIDDEEYSTTRDEMLKVINKKQWDEIFPEDNVQVIKAEVDFVTEKEESEVSETVCDDEKENTQGNNPVAQLLTAMFTPVVAMMNGTQQDFDVNEFAGSIQKAFSPMQVPVQKQLSLSEEVTTISNRVVELEGERDKAIKDVAFYIEKTKTLEAKVKDYEDSIQSHESEAQGYLSERAEFEKRVEAAKKEAVAISNKNRELEAELEKKTKNCENAFRERDSLQKELTAVKQEFEKQSKDSTKVIADLKAEHQKKIDKLMSELRNAEADLKSAKSDADFREKKFNELKNRFDEVKSDTSATDKIVKDYENKLKESNKTIEEFKRKAEKADELKNELKSVKKDNSDLQSNFDKLSKENDSLNELAYYDKKIGVLNTNAFNRDFAAIDTSSMNLVITGIKNMKNVNENAGRKAGDKLIKIAAGHCKELFGNNNVYKIFGDEFGIITDKSTDEIKDIMDVIVDTLSDQQINMVYGFADGKKCAGLAAMVSTAEGEMNEMKRNGSNVKAQNKKVVEMPKSKSSASRNDEPEELDTEALLAEYMNAEN